MSKYSYLISQMTWSYSRLKCFEDCPYRFLLNYIYPSDEAPMFYAEYGSLVHELLAGYYAGMIRKERLVQMFVSGFVLRIRGRVSPEISRKFFDQGVACMERVQPCPYEIAGVEQEIRFTIDGYHFTGFVDLLIRKPDGGFVIVDHKSRLLKQRSNRKKPTRYDSELDEYLRQLYLYAVWVEQRYGVLPDELVFHCYRSGEVIRQPFDKAAYEEAKAWAVGMIHQIEAAEDYDPHIDFFSCRYLCGVHEDCIYSELGG